MGDRRFPSLCRGGDIERVQAALDSGTNVNEEGVLGQTGLMMALDNSRNNVVQLLLNHPDIDINKVDREGDCALHWAVIRDNHEGMAALLDRQELTTINQRSDYGWTPIMRAVAYNEVNCFNLLLNHAEVDLDIRDNYERSPEEVRR